jgi:hypothetical protein
MTRARTLGFLRSPERIIAILEGSPNELTSNEIAERLGKLTFKQAGYLWDCR